MAILKSRAVSGLLASLTLGLCSLIGYSLFIQDPLETSRSGVASAEDAHNGKPEMQASYAFEASDKRKLVGASENVFVGRVLKKVGSKGIPALRPIPGEDNSSPATQFEVEVMNSIKGELEGRVIVNQHGGNDRDGQLILLERDPLFELGKVYIISSNYEQKRDWQQVVAQPFGKVKTKDVKDKAKKVKEFKVAKQNQIPLDSTVRNPAARN